MSLDVVDLKSFYAGALGRVARRFVGATLRQRWPDCVGLTVVGLGYATPFLGAWRDQAVRALAFMPGEQGVISWPKEGPNAAALVDAAMTPLPDGCVDRLLMIHALENAVDPEELLSEAWRIRPILCWTSGWRTSTIFMVGRAKREAIILPDRRAEPQAGPGNLARVSRPCNLTDIPCRPILNRNGAYQCISRLRWPLPSP